MYNRILYLEKNCCSLKNCTSLIHTAKLQSISEATFFPNSYTICFQIMLILRWLLLHILMAQTLLRRSDLIEDFPNPVQHEVPYCVSAFRKKNVRGTLGLQMQLFEGWGCINFLKLSPGVDTNRKKLQMKWSKLGKIKRIWEYGFVARNRGQYY